MPITTVFPMKYDKGKETAAGNLTLAGGGKDMSSGAGCLERLSGGRMFKPSGAAGYGWECIAN